MSFGKMEKERLAGVAASTKPTGGEKEDTADRRRAQDAARYDFIASGYLQAIFLILNYELVCCFTSVINGMISVLQTSLCNQYKLAYLTQSQ